MESVKLQKFVSECGLMSRRKAEEEIQLGHFQVDGVVATLGMRIDPVKATVTYKGKCIEKVERKQDLHNELKIAVNQIESRLQDIK